MPGEGDVQRYRAYEKVHREDDVRVVRVRRARCKETKPHHLGEHPLWPCVRLRHPAERVRLREDELFLRAQREAHFPQCVSDARKHARQNRLRDEMERASELEAPQPVQAQGRDYRRQSR